MWCGCDVMWIKTCENFRCVVFSSDFSHNCKVFIPASFESFILIKLYFLWSPEIDQPNCVILSPKWNKMVKLHWKWLFHTWKGWGLRVVENHTGAEWTTVQQVDWCWLWCECEDWVQHWPALLAVCVLKILVSWKCVRCRALQRTIGICVFNQTQRSQSHISCGAFGIKFQMLIH